ncbi:MAG: tetraacyldisaccharide 4'-kinase [Pseudomonadota bacterium]
MSRAPRFWDKAETDWRAHVLRPLGALYAQATARRLSKGVRARIDVPVVCVGNINVGGTGKTPTVIAIVEQLRDRFHQPHIISRGYGGRVKGPMQVDPRKHTAADVGDEPLLLSAFAEVWVAQDRLAAARAAQSAGATVLVLDDGFQDPALHHDLALVVVNAAKGFGNGLCLPAGPLREPAAVGLRRADLLLSIGSSEGQSRFVSRTSLPAELTHVTAELRPLETGMDWSDTRALAFAGIGHPEKFFATLKSLGATLVRTEALDDHQPLNLALMARLEADALALNAQLVTTEKDAVRLSPAFRSKVITLPVRLALPAKNALWDRLAELGVKKTS